MVKHHTHSLYKSLSKCVALGHVNFVYTLKQSQ